MAELVRRPRRKRRRANETKPRAAPRLITSQPAQVNQYATGVEALSDATPSEQCHPEPVARRGRFRLSTLQRNVSHSAYIFTGERREPLTDFTEREMVARESIAAGLEFPAHPDMLCDAAGHKPANDGQYTRVIRVYLGHPHICHMVRYTELPPERFKDLWQE